MSISWGGMTWVNQPRQWRREGGDLHVRTDHGSDFWRWTATGVDRDSGHAFLAREKGDLAAETTVYADLAESLDQAGLMIRAHGWLWVKFAVQLVSGAVFATVTATRDGSDWSVHPLPGGGSAPVRLRLERVGGTVFLRCAVEEDVAQPTRRSLKKGKKSAYGQRRLDPVTNGWHLLRVVPFPAATPVGIGPMCASPAREGLEVTFSNSTIESDGPNWVWL